MTDEQILKLASKHLRFFEDGWRGTEWSGKPENLLKFARALYEEGFDDGYDKGYDHGTLGGE
jgi:hypothetical protein